MQSILNAQNWASVETKWIYEINSELGQEKTYLEYEVEKDTIVQGKICSKIIKHSADLSCFNRPNIEYTYISNDSVFFFSSYFNDFRLVYMQNVSVSSSWQIEYFDYFNNAIDTVSVFVDSIKTLNIDNVMLQKVYTHHSNSINSNENQVFLFEYIENIGGVNYMFDYMFHPKYVCDGDFPNGLKCFNDNTMFDVQLDDDFNCDIGTDVFETNTKLQISLTPNPFSDILQIIVENANDYKHATIEIYTFEGKRILSTHFSETLDLSFLPDGLYFLKISSIESFETIKFLKKS